MPEILEASLDVYFRDPANGLQTASRLAARRQIANFVGRAVNLGRIRQDNRSPIAMFMNRIAGRRFDDVYAEPDHAQAVVQFSVVGNEAPILVQELAEKHLRLSLIDYRGDIGNDGYVYGCTVLRDAMEIPALPIDASDSWRFGYSTDMLITYKQDSN